MKNVKPIVLSGILVLAVSVPAFAKGGTISATRTGTISATKTGTISGTRMGTISATRTGTISATRTDVAISSNQSWYVELLLTVLAGW